ncbi:MAG: hypothetical protein IPH88_18835 [Bacteroidales bacterium]|nr:hypothetical protein [Bacteroidales bacterium]
MKELRHLLIFAIALMFSLRLSGAVAYPSESILIHTDRKLYISGDALFFSLRLIENGEMTEGNFSQFVYVVLRNKSNQAVQKVCLKLSGSKAYGILHLPDTLSSGSYQLVAFTQWMRNFGEKNFAQVDLCIANLFDKELSGFEIPESMVSLNDSISGQQEISGPVSIEGVGNSEYKCGGTVQLKFMLSDTLAKWGDFSISVREAIPGEAFDRSNEKITNYQPFPEKLLFLPEKSNQILSGTVKRKKGSEEKQEIILLSANDSLVNLQYSTTGNPGQFQFELPAYYEGKDLYLYTPGKDSYTMPELELRDKFELMPGSFPNTEKPSEAIINLIRTHQDFARISRYYNLSQDYKFSVKEPEELHQPRMFMSAGSTIYTRDYLPLENFEEISREILPSVQVKKSGSSWSLQVEDEVHHGFLQGNAAVFLNGVLVQDNSEIKEWGSSRIEKIEVLKRLLIYGSLRFEGVVGIMGKEGETMVVPNNPGMIKTRQPLVLNFGRPVFKVNSEKSVKTTPDFRSLLYWDPDFRISGKESGTIEFAGSLHQGEYIVELKGMTSDGRLIHEWKTITITR